MQLRPVLCAVSEPGIHSALRRWQLLLPTLPGSLRLLHRIIRRFRRFGLSFSPILRQTQVRALGTAMNRYTPLLSTPDLALGRFDHPPECDHHDPREECAASYAVNFVERGHFHLSAEKQSWRLAPGDVLVDQPGAVRRFRHDEGCLDDVCLSLSYKNRKDDGKARRFPKKAPVIAATNRLRYLGWTLAACATGFRESLGVEVRAAEVLQEIDRAFNEPPRKPYSPRQLHWYAERVDAIRQTLETRFSRPHSLHQLAESVGMSTFHFARIFSELEGIPPHRYLLQVRLKSADRMLRNGASVTDACFAAGFNNLSHFVRLFQRHYGTTPSAFARNRRAPD